MSRMLRKETLVVGILGGLTALGLVSYVIIRSGAFRPHVSATLDRRHVAPDSSAVEGPVALSESESRALGRISSRGLAQPYTAGDVDSLNAIWAVVEKRTGKNVSQKGARTYAGGLRDAYKYLHEFQNCLLASFDSRMPVTTPRLFALRKRVVEAHVVSREKVSGDSGLICEAATRMTSRDFHKMSISREGMVLRLHRIEQLGRNVDFLDSALAATPTK